MINESILNETGHWHIRLLGTLEVQKPNGDCVVLKNRKAGELLAYLALYPNQPHSRHKLTALLWGDTEVTNERTRLRQEIAAMRSLFPADGEQYPLFHSSQSELRIDPNVEIDAIQFHEISIRAKRESDAEKRAILLEKALGLYRADLLEAYDFAWIVAERERYRQLHEQMLFELAEAQHQHQNFAGEEETLRRLLFHDPLNEKSHIALMRLYEEVEHPAVLHHIDSTNLSDNGKHEVRSNGVHAETASEPELHQPAKTILEPRTVHRAINPIFHRRFIWLIPVILVLAVLSAGIWRWKSSRQPHPSLLAASPAKSFQPRWTYLDKARPGEKGNSQGNAITSDDANIYVTGMVQTYKDDVDILTLKLSKEGKLLWRARYSSPEHECDQAYSLCLERHGGVFVLGETFVPAKPGAPEGWFFTLLHYDIDGKKGKWVRRSNLHENYEGHKMQVVPDGQNGCYLGGTALVNGKRSILVMHYNIAGKLLWQKTIQEGDENSFSRFAADTQGNIFLCGTARYVKKGGVVNDCWLILSFDLSGKEQWRRPLVRHVTGSDAANNLILDRGGDVVVSGVVDSGSTGSGGKGLQLALDKFSSNGAHLWHQPVKDTGPHISQEGLSNNFQGDIALGGTEFNADGSTGIVLEWFDSTGNNTRSWRYPLPTGYRSAGLNVLSIDRVETINFIGQLSRKFMNDERTLLVGTINFKGGFETQSLFGDNPLQHYFPTDSCLFLGEDAVTGQAALSNKEHTLLVNFY